MLAGAFGFFGCAISFAEITRRVPSYGDLTAAATLLGLAGAITAIWRPRIGAWLLVAAVVSLLVLIGLLLRWALVLAVERDAGFAAYSIPSTLALLLPALMLALGAALAWRLASRQFSAWASTADRAEIEMSGQR